MALRMGDKPHHGYYLFCFLTHHNIFPSHKMFHTLGILNPTELPDNDWINQRRWIYEKEKELLVSKRALERIKAWGMRKEVPLHGKVLSRGKEVSLWCPNMCCSTGVVGDRREVGWLLHLRCDHAITAGYCGCSLFAGVMGVKSKTRQGSLSWWLQCSVSWWCCLYNLGELINFLPGALGCSFFSYVHYPLGKAQRAELWQFSSFFPPSHTVRWKSWEEDDSAWCASTCLGKSPPLIMTNKH